MIIVNILGGLGNQMFQYAFHHSLRGENINSKINITDYQNYSLHNGLELSKIFDIPINDQIAAENELKTIKDTASFFKMRKLLGLILFNNPNMFIKRTHFIQPNFSKFYSFNYLIKWKYLEGYWQTEKYFIHKRSELLNIFEWKNVSEINQKMIIKFSAENSVAVHIRRYDKVKSFRNILYHIKLRMLWRVSSKQYYLKAIQYFILHTYNPQFYVFTDNVQWAKKNLPNNINITIVDWNRNEDSHFDMLLMSKCKNNIISMSSFSWWGAWLNQNPKKIIVAPKEWALRLIKDINLIPIEWIRI